MLSMGDIFTNIMDVLMADFNILGLGLSRDRRFNQQGVVVVDPVLRRRRPCRLLGRVDVSYLDVSNGGAKCRSSKMSLGPSVTVVKC